MDLDQILSQVKEGDKVEVTIVTNQDNGIVSYATGQLAYHPSSSPGPLKIPSKLLTTGAEPLKYYFSDRMLGIDPPPPPNTVGHPSRQPFSANSIDKLGVLISVSPLFTNGTISVKFTLNSWGNATFSVSMEKRGKLLIGTGPAIGHNTDHAVYLISFNGISRPPVIK